VDIKLRASKSHLDAAVIKANDKFNQVSVSMIYQCFANDAAIPLLINGRETSSGFGTTSANKERASLHYGSKIPITIAYSDLDGRTYTSKQTLVVTDSERFAGMGWE
jgi:hypothetical protein